MTLQAGIRGEGRSTIRSTRHRLRFLDVAPRNIAFERCSEAVLDSYRGRQSGGSGSGVRRPIVVFHKNQCGRSGGKATEDKSILDSPGLSGAEDLAGAYGRIVYISDSDGVLDLMY